MSEPELSESAATVDEARRTWKQAVAPYQVPDLRRGLWQLVNSLVPYLVLWYAAYRLLAVSYWLTLAATVLAAGFLIRLFIIFHDCGHGSFFRSRTANRVVGVVTGVLTFTPFQDWRHEHALHHATAGNLDRRGYGDVWTLTVAEYRRASFWRRLAYRSYRHPAVLLGLGPLFMFLVLHRLPRPGRGSRERLSVHWTNLAVVAMLAAMAGAIGTKATVLVQLPILIVAGAAGIWLFYVQHQFETVYWERDARRDHVAVALLGSSFYGLPGVLQWFTGNIGFHHIHHLSPQIPNYRLAACFREQPLFQKVPRITLASSLRTLFLRLYDEDARRLVSFRRVDVAPLPAAPAR